MGVDIVRLDGEAGKVVPKMALEDLAKVNFQSYHITQPDMGIWLMTTRPGARVFPWWGFQLGSDEDISALQKLWSITNEQGLFDCLFLSHFAKFAKPHLYAILPGSIRSQGWSHLKPMDQSVFSKGQSCIYRLDGTFDGQLKINWIPFGSAQSLVKDPDFGSLWRLFLAGAPESEANSLCLFGLSNPRMLPDVIQVLINQEPNRSMKLLELVDWFALYSSPLEQKFGACAVLYSRKKEVIEAVQKIQEPFQKVIERTQIELIADVRPRVAIRIVSRHVVL